MIITAISMSDTKIQPTIGVYLHGKLEKENGYDLCKVDECESGFYRNKEDGIYPCTVEMTNGNRYEATMYLWQIPLAHNTKQTKALVVRNDDTKSVEDAKTKYENRSIWI